MIAPDGGPRGSSAPAQMLVDVIGRVALLEQRVSHLGSDLAEIGAIETETQSLVKVLQSQINELTMRVEAMADDGGEEHADELALVDWSSLDKATARQEWDRLYQWLDAWLVPTYRVTIAQLRPCWPAHPEVREELSWLHAAWMQTYRRPYASASAAGEWHLRWLPGALDRLASHFRRAECTLGQHAGETFPDRIRSLPSAHLSRRDCWVDDGRLQDIDSRS